MWSQSYLILSSSFEGRSLSTFFSLLLLLCLPVSVSPGLNFALQLFPLNLPPLTYQLPTSHPSSFSHHIMFCCSPFPGMQLSGLPSQDTPLSVGECVLGWGWGRLCLVCFREQSKGSTWEEVARAGLGELASSAVWGR